MDEQHQPASGVPDLRTRAHGWPVFFMGLLALGAGLFTWRGIVAATNAAMAGGIADTVTTLLAMILWVFGAAGIIHNGRKMRHVAIGAWGLNVLGSISGFAGIDYLHVNPWFEGGVTYFYLPFLGAILALVWLWWSAPARVAGRGA